VRIVFADNVVPKAQATARLSLPHPALETTSRFIGEVFQEKGVHRTFEPDMQLADLTLGKGEQTHAGEAQPLEQAGDILLVA
jgi:hypothetical protein